MTSDPTPIVYVLDDDDSVCRSIAYLLGVIDVEVLTYGRPADFLADFRPGRPGCLLLDVRMPGMSGLELQERLQGLGVDVPIVFLSGHGDIPMVVRAMQNGAMNFLPKPFNDQHLIEQVQRAIAHDRQQQAIRHAQLLARTRIETLSPRERSVCALIVEGLTNKQAAAKLFISPKTVENHRAHVMQKMEADSLASLIRQWKLAYPDTPGTAGATTTQGISPRSEG